MKIPRRKTLFWSIICELLTVIEAALTAYTANVMTIKTMDFDHVPNPGIDPPEFLGFFDYKFKKKNE
jgi:hypothetical protein